MRKDSYNSCTCLIVIEKIGRREKTEEETERKREEGKVKTSRETSVRQGKAGQEEGHAAVRDHEGTRYGYIAYIAPRPPPPVWLRQAGKLLSDKEKQDRRRAMQLLETMKAQGMVIIVYESSDFFVQ